MEKIRYIFAQSLIIWAFGCLVNGHYMASGGIAVWAAAVAYTSCNMEKQKRILPVLIPMAIIGLIAIQCCGLKEYLPFLGIVWIANCYVSLVFPVCYRKETEKAMQTMIIIGLVYVLLALLVPSVQFAFTDLLVLIALIFAPVSIMYACLLDMERKTAGHVERDVSLR